MTSDQNTMRLLGRWHSCRNRLDAEPTLLSAIRALGFEPLHPDEQERHVVFNKSSAAIFFGVSAKQIGRWLDGETESLLGGPMLRQVHDFSAGQRRFVVAKRKDLEANKQRIARERSVRNRRIQDAQGRFGRKGRKQPLEPCQLAELVVILKTGGFGPFSDDQLLDEMWPPRS